DEKLNGDPNEQFMRQMEFWERVLNRNTAPPAAAQAMSPDMLDYHLRKMELELQHEIRKMEVSGNSERAAAMRELTTQITSALGSVRGGSNGDGSGRGRQRPPKKRLATYACSAPGCGNQWEADPSLTR